MLKPAIKDNAVSDDTSIDSQANVRPGETRPNSCETRPLFLAKHEITGDSVDWIAASGRASH